MITKKKIWKELKGLLFALYFMIIGGLAVKYPEQTLRYGILILIILAFTYGFVTGFVNELININKVTKYRLTDLSHNTSIEIHVSYNPTRQAIKDELFYAFEDLEKKE